MPQIQVKFENTLEQSDIIIPLTNSSEEEAGKDYRDNQPAIQQTSVYGIQAPLIMVNNIVVDFTDVIYFNLKSKSRYPEIDITVRDRYNLLASLDTPGIDNELRVQVLPKFDNKYKKINLTFFITRTTFRGDEISIKGVYKLSKFTSSQIKSFGEIGTYGLFETIATETGLGYATNIESSEEDKRWVYCDYKSYGELLDTEISLSGFETKIYDWWIDSWNNLNLVDIYDRYNSIDSEDDMKLWVSCQNREVTEGIENEPVEVAAILNNHPMNDSSELFVEEYNITNNPGSQIIGGTDRIFSTYELDKGEYMDTLIQDGDTHKDIFYKYEYLGEVYGEYNYLLSSKKRETFMQKIQSNENVRVVLRTPLLGILRGNKINFSWYINDSIIAAKQEVWKNEGLINDPETNIPMEGSDPDNQSNDGEYILDKSISGQYMITGTEMEFSNMQWKYAVLLSRPSSQKPKIINDNE